MLSHPENLGSTCSDYGEVERGGREVFFRVRFLSLRLGRRCITTNHIKYEYIYTTQNAAFYMLHAASTAFCACHRGLALTH